MLASVVIMAASGYILSLDLSGLGVQIIDRFSKKKSETLQLIQHACIGFLWRWTGKEAIFHCGMLLLTVAAAAASFYMSQQMDLNYIAQYIGYICIGLFIIEVILCELQSVYVIFGAFRNTLFPKSVMQTKLFEKKKRKLNCLGMTRRMLMEFGKVNKKYRII